MLCLGVESSCDDTCLALVQDGKTIAEVSNSQAHIHALFGGVVPEVASREHARLIGPLCDALFAKAGCSAEDISLVAVARGPGLLGSLLVGIAFAKAFALGRKIPIIGIHHLHAHLFAAGIEHEFPLPALGLLVSGGHTHLYRIEAPHKYNVLGKTLDDAAGEAFDKAGKMLGLPYPAGKHIDFLSRQGVADTSIFPRPYINNDLLDFSFSGLKTAMAAYLQKNPLPPASFVFTSGELEKHTITKELCDICASYTSAIVDTLVIKTDRALQTQEDVRALILAGGVAANSFLRLAIERLALDRGLPFFVPPLSLCADNATMIAFLGEKLAKKGYQHNISFSAIPRGQIIPDDMYLKE